MSLIKNNQEMKIKLYDTDRSQPLEIRLLQFFVIAEEVWALFNFIMSIVFNYPEATQKMYGIFAMSLLLYWLCGSFSGYQKVYINLYFILFLISNPFVWYYAGGNEASANILFVAELIAFVMCMNGVKQKVFIVLSLFSSTLVYALKAALPNYQPLAMTPIQLAHASRNIGITTSLLIIALLLKQKKEYARERDIAINSEKELEKSNQMQKNFLANMSHEIRSPLGIVLGFNGLISESNDLVQIHEYSQNIEHAGKTLNTVINDILDYSKIESGKLDIIDTDYSFKELISEVRNDIELKCAEKGLTFDLENDANIPQYLFGDNIRIKQCLLNLLSNAVKYTDKGTVTLSTQRLPSEQDGYCNIQFTVSDTGRGMKEETIPQLFDAFQRLDEGQNRGIEGTGLGLAITKNLLDEMNGTIEVQSEYGKGSVFTIRLLQQISAEQHDEVDEKQTENDISDLRILVVDDTKLNLSLIQKILVKQNAVVKTVDNGPDSLTECQKNKYDVILLDHMMPQMDGVEVFMHLRNEEGLNQHTPVIMLTANAMAGASKEYADLGFDGYVSKPIAPKALIDEICKVK